VSQETFLMDDRRDRVAAIKARLERREYRVDAVAVADALLARAGRGARRTREAWGAEGLEAYDECSYPWSSAPGASLKVSREGPASTRPIQLRLRAQVRAAASALSRALAGTQTQSS
jgi:hypothetical protein